MKCSVRGISLAIAALALSSVASGYYHYVHFITRTAPFVPAPEKFDVTALRNKTVYYLISEQGPTKLAAGDTFQGLISEIRLAAATWDSVGTSDLRIGFGGMEALGTPQNSPGIDVIFDDDVPPGLAALGGVTSSTSPVQLADGSAFFPVTRGTLNLRTDLQDSPSFGESTFSTLVHEFGHCLGLQHTLTSAAMSTQITRATTRSKPLADDDVAAISVLYPTATGKSKTATLTGHVTMGSNGVNLASVVAISATGSAISTLTNPDGSYTLQYIPPGTYSIYVHPLPPALNGEVTPAGITPPLDPDGKALPMTGSFTTQFYPGTRDPKAATPITLNAGDKRESVDMAVQPRTVPAVSSIVAYGYVGQTAVYPAPFVGTGPGGWMVARGEGLVPAANSLAAGLGIDVLGEAGASVQPGSIKNYSYPYMQFFVNPAANWTPGSRHLLFSTADDMYVLPASLLLVAKPAPAITSVTETPNATGGTSALIAGSNFDSTTRILFDGVTAPILARGIDGSLLVAQPAALPGHRANVVALNGDGQSSLFGQPSGGPAFGYAAGNTPTLAMWPSSLPAGAESLVQIDGAGTNFVDGQTVVGFGTSDIAVRQLWVTGPNRLFLNISVAASAASTSTTLTVTTGLQTISIPFAFLITPPSQPQSATAGTSMVMVPPLLNATTSLPGAPSGGTAVLSVSNLTLPATSLMVLVGDQLATILSAANGQITFQVPAGLPLGAAVVRLITQDGVQVQPVMMDITLPPPVIGSVYSATGVIADGTNPATPGATLTLVVSGFPASIAAADPASVKVNVGGTSYPAQSLSTQSADIAIRVMLPLDAATGARVPVTVGYQNLLSLPSAVAIQAPLPAPVTQ